MNGYGEWNDRGKMGQERLTLRVYPDGTMRIICRHSWFNPSHTLFPPEAEINAVGAFLIVK